ncbi:UNVERIFIED_CONTAM: hypothetical protein FKN15_049776 [Acipenser sinensis]
MTSSVPPTEELNHHSTEAIALFASQDSKATSYRVRGRSGAPAAASMTRGSPPEFASRGSAAAAVTSRGSAAAAIASRGSAAAEGSASPGVATSPAMRQEILWLEPHEGELPTTKKGGIQETSSPSRTFAAGGTVAEAPEEGVTSQEDMGGGGPPTMATHMDYSRPLFQDIETEGGGAIGAMCALHKEGDM